MIAVSTTSEALKDKAVELAHKLKLPFVPLEISHYPLLLILTTEHLELRDMSQPKLKPLFIDFDSGKLLHRLRFGGGKNQLIARAVGIKSKLKPVVLDLTAGLGEDAFILANLGCQITLLERNPIMAALLQDGLTRRLSKMPPMTFIETESFLYLQNLKKEEYPEVIYLDPMFPPSIKSALVKKEMRMLRSLVGDDIDAGELLELALTKAKNRVVVKRPRLSVLLNERKPNLVFSGKSSRFDVYLTVL